MKNIKTTILETLQKDTLHMIPKWKFVLYSSLGIIGLIFTFLLTVFIVSLILFVLSRYGLLHMPFFEFMGALQALTVIPIVLLLVAVILLVLLEVCSRYYSFSFTLPLSVTLLILMCVVAGSSYLVSQTQVHDYARDYADRNHLNMMVQAYDRPVPFKKINGLDVLRGEVVATSTDSVTIEMLNGTAIVAYGTSSDTVANFVPPLLDTDIIILGNFIQGRFIITNMRSAGDMPFGKYKRTHHYIQGMGGKSMMNTTPQHMQYPHMK